jgi:putative transposase
MKNRILLENYYLPGQLEQSIGEFVEHYNNRRYHESLDNRTPADIYFVRAPAILKRRDHRDMGRRPIRVFPDRESH